MKKSEQTFLTKFQRWAKHNINYSCAFEGKIVEGTGRLNYKAIPEHELTNLWIAKHFKVVHKLSDLSRMGTIFDGFVLCGVEAYLVVHWRRRGNKEFFMIDIDVIQNEIKSGCKSLTEERANVIGVKCLLK